MNQLEDKSNFGRVHSLESLGSVDGPGLRFIVFMQGCILRCQYCHNPDTWEKDCSKIFSVDEIFAELESLKNYFTRSNGGITISGGEPLVQVEFITTLLNRCQESGIHTALDTTGIIFNDLVKDALKYVDLVLLDIKGLDDQFHRELTGVSNKNFYKFINYLKLINKPFWARYVLVPGLTDQEERLQNTAEFLKDYPNLEKVEVLPFHKMGEYKWENLGLEAKLKSVSEPSAVEVEKAAEYFRAAGLGTNFL